MATAEMTQREKILAYLEEHPRSDSIDICCETGIGMNRMSVELAALKRHGFVVSEKVPGRRALRFSLHPRYSGSKCETPVQVVVKEWDRPGVEPQSWASPLGV